MMEEAPAFQWIGPDAGGRYRFALHGFKVPRVEGRIVPGSETLWKIVLDGRFSIEARQEELASWLWLVANAMAIGAGFSCFGENSQPANPYGTRIAEIEL